MTLIEVLIALFIIAMIAVSLPIMCDTILRAKAISEAENEQGRTIGTIYHELDAVNLNDDHAREQSESIIKNYPHFSLTDFKKNGSLITVNLQYKNQTEIRKYEQIFYETP